MKMIVYLISDGHVAGKLSEPCENHKVSTISPRRDLVGDYQEQEVLTAVDILLSLLGLAALHGSLSGLRLENRALVVVAASIHSLLESITLPAEEIITMVTKTSAAEK